MTTLENLVSIVTLLDFDTEKVMKWLHCHGITTVQELDDIEPQLRAETMQMDFGVSPYVQYVLHQGVLWLRQLDPTIDLDDSIQAGCDFARYEIHGYQQDLKNTD